MDGLKNVSEDLMAERGRISSELPQDIIDIIKSSTLDLTKDNPDPEPLIMLDNVPLCTRDNFSFIIGLPGSRKSFLCTAIAGAYLNENGYLGMENANGAGRLLWVDTEQAPGHVARIGRRLNRIIGLNENENNPNATILMLRPYSPEKRFEVTKIAIEYMNPDFIVIDGLADLMSDPNNTEQSTMLSTFLLETTQMKHCHILTVIHANIGSEKARGHLGSDAYRKCETAMLIKADGPVSKISFVKSRDFMPSEYAFTITNGLPVLAELQPKKVNMSGLQETFSTVMPPYPATISSSDLVNKIMAHKNIQLRAAKYNIKNAAANGIIVSNQYGRYYLPQPTDSHEQELPF